VKIKTERGNYMRKLSGMLATLMLLAGTTQSHAATSILFIGNSFTFGQGSAVRYYHPETVTDLNNLGIGGVPALFKSFTRQAGLDYDVYLETQPGSGLEFHIENRLAQIGRRPWDTVVMHGQSNLDFGAPGDATKLVNTSKEIAGIFLQHNPEVDIYLTATWSRADLIYRSDSPWAGTPVQQMAVDVRAGNDQAAAAVEAIRSVNPVGEAWNRAFESGVADANPYDGIDADKLDLWTYDHYHASTFGYYLHALVVFGNVTGIDPRALGAVECSGFELGMSQGQVSALQQVAYDQLASEGKVKAAPFEPAGNIASQPCS
jgi:hypothetical protein